jgi:undecaprenyl diphosphate synthase
VEVLTLYSFSSENWRRPGDEIEALMRLCVAYCEGEKEELLRHNIRVRVIGRRAGLPADVLGALDALTGATASCTGLTLCLAINYGSRDEIVHAIRTIATEVAAGRMRPEEIEDATVTDHLETGGELRLSNYLLWQISYAELYVTDEFWPDFTEQSLFNAIRAYAARNRRFGGLDPSSGVGIPG